MPRLLLILAVLSASGCAAHPRAICFAPDLSEYGPQAWADEANRRLPGAVVIVSHGIVAFDERWNAHWCIAVDPDLFAQFLKQQFPGRPIVFAACNTGKFSLKTRGVWYAKDIVWVPPHPATTQPGVKSINDFVEGGP